MMGSGIDRQDQASEHDGVQLGGLHLPIDVWSVILAKAAAPLRQLPNEDGLSHVACWLDLALVCKQWHEVMLSLPVGLRFHDGLLHPPSAACRGEIFNVQYSSIVAAVRGLAASRVPICRLDLPVRDHAFAASDSDGDRPVKLEMSRAMSNLFESPKFLARSGPHLTAVKYHTGLVYNAPATAFPQLQHLAYVHTRLAQGLPPSLQWLGLRGDLEVTFGSGFISASEVGVRADEAIPHIASLHRLQHLTLCECRISKALLAALPPSLTRLRLHQCQLAAGEADFPPQLVRTSYEVDHAGLFSGTFELAAGLVINDPGRQLAPAAPPA